MTMPTDSRGLRIIALLVVAVIITAVYVVHAYATSGFKDIVYNNGLGTQVSVSFYKDATVVKEAAIDSSLGAKSDLMVLAANQDKYGKARLVMYVLQSSSSSSQASYKHNTYCQGLPTVFNVYNSYLNATIKVCSFKDALYYAPFEKGSTVYLVAFTQDNTEMVSEENDKSTQSPPLSFGLSPYNNDIRTFLSSLQLIN